MCKKAILTADLLAAQLMSQTPFISLSNNLRWGSAMRVVKEPRGMGLLVLQLVSPLGSLEVDLQARRLRVDGGRRGHG